MVKAGRKRGSATVPVRVPKEELTAWKRVTALRIPGHVPSDREAATAALRVALYFSSDDDGFVEVTRRTISENVRKNTLALLRLALPEAEISIDEDGDKYTITINNGNGEDVTYTLQSPPITH